MRPALWADAHTQGKDTEEEVTDREPQTARAPLSSGALAVWPLSVSATMRAAPMSIVAFTAEEQIDSTAVMRLNLFSVPRMATIYLSVVPAAGSFVRHRGPMQGI